MTVISINGVLFSEAAKYRKHIVVSGAASGFYRVRGRNIHLFNLSGERIGGINRHECLYRSARIEGVLYHFHGNPDGIPEFSSFGARLDEASSIMRQIFDGE